MNIEYTMLYNGVPTSAVVDDIREGWSLILDYHITHRLLSGIIAPPGYDGLLVRLDDGLEHGLNIRCADGKLILENFSDDAACFAEFEGGAAELNNDIQKALDAYTAKLTELGQALI